MYFHIYSSNNNGESSLGTTFWNNPLKMNEKGDDNADINVALDINLDFVDSLRVSIRDKDNKADSEGSSNWDLIGDAHINRDSPIEGRIGVNQTTGKAKAFYYLSYRIIFKPIQTLRVFGLYCEQDSAGTSGTAVIDLVLGVAQECCDKAADVMKKSPRPRAQAMSKGFKAATKVLEEIAEFTAFIANLFEGDDDVYMQKTQGGTSVDGGNFFPPEGYGKNYKMKKVRDHNGEVIHTDKNTVFFEEEYGKYFRIPLDKGDVTLQLKDSDRTSGDDSIGALTINSGDFDRLQFEGAQVEIAAKEWGNENQGAIYHICYSVGVEDWSKPATADAQGEVDPPENPPEEGALYSIVNKNSGKALFVRDHSMEWGGRLSQITKLSHYSDQRWKIQYDGSTALLTNDMSKLVACVQGLKAGNKAIQVSKGNYEDQRWRFGDAGDGYVYIVNARSGKYLNVSGGSKEDYAEVIQWNSGNGDNQKWKFVKI